MCRSPSSAKKNQHVQLVSTAFEMPTICSVLSLCRPSLNIGLSFNSETKSFEAVSNDSETSLAPLGLIRSSYPLMELDKEMLPCTTALIDSTSSAASCMALFRPWPRSFHSSVSYRDAEKFHLLGSIECAASPARVTVPARLFHNIGDHCWPGSAGTTVSSGIRAAAVRNGSQILELRSLKNLSRTTGSFRSAALGAPHQA